MVFSKDGMRVGVKEVRRDAYVDGTQRFVFVPFFSRVCVFWGMVDWGEGMVFKGELWLMCGEKLVYW